jgi:hypothetical protein
VTEQKYIIRTSDRISFKSCRQSWDYGSKLRQNYEPVALPKPLDFGTAIHSGAEVLYDPRTWEWPRDVVEAAALQAFIDENRSALTRWEKLTESSDELVREDFKERSVLGVGMLKNYFAWARNNDPFTPILVEAEFEVPIPAGHLTKFPEDMYADDEGNLQKRSPDGTEWWPVVYQGRIDMIIKDEHGRYWIVDHKTCAQMRQDVVTFMEMDEQLKSYGWAIQKQLGIPIAGLALNELYKGVPAPPKQNTQQRKGCWFSVNKMQDTTYELYLETVSTQDAGAYEQGLYDDILAYLKNQGNKYFRRTWTAFTQPEYDNLGEQICLEAIDMLSDPLIYPNPSRFKCGYCMFRAPCLSRMESSDEALVLQQLYVQRVSRQTELPYTRNPQEEETLDND